MGADDIQLREVLFEFRRVGRYVKVSAIDPVTAIEVSMVGDPKRGDMVKFTVSKGHDGRRRGEAPPAECGLGFQAKGPARAAPSPSFGLGRAGPGPECAPAVL